MFYTCKPERLAIYINSKRLTIDEIKAETGADVIINGGLYTMATWTPVCHLKADGKVYAADEWSYFGYGWHSGKADIRITSQYADLDNYICCVCLVYQGKKQELIYPADMGGKRPRTMIGLYPDGQMLIICGETYSPESLREYALRVGLDSAIMLDGGGSSQAITPVGAFRQSRKCHNFILAWLKNPAVVCPYAEPSGLQYKGMRGEGVKWLQWHLNMHKARLEVDGIFGGKTHAAVMVFQSGSGLVADGLVGDLTRAKLKQIKQPDESDIITPAYVWRGNLSYRSSTRYIILHHAAADCTAEQTHLYHRDSKGWSGIGYNLFVGLDGKVYAGRPINAVGAHCVGYNANSVGICFAGNFETSTMSAAQIAAGKKAVAYARSYYPSAIIKLHRELDATACPGRNFPAGEFR